MSKRIFNHRRFDGGMTDSPRDTADLTKLAYISHLDIYRDHNRMFVMPGYVAVNGFNNNSTAIKAYKPQDVNVSFDATLLLSKKSNGTGWRIFQLDIGETQWKVPDIFSTYEGTDELVARPFLASIGISSTQYFPVTISDEERIARLTISTYDGTWADTRGSAASGFRHNFIRNTPADKVLFTYGGFAVAELSTTNVTWTAKSTQQGVFDIATANYTVGITTGNSLTEQGRLLIWDDASLLSDQKINFGLSLPRVIGAPSGVYATVNSDYLFSSEATANPNGRSEMSVKFLSGEIAENFYSIKGFYNANNLLYSVKEGYRQIMTWYSYFATNVGATELENGIWAFGKGSINSQFGVSKLLDTTKLGRVVQSRWIGDTCWFINHSGDFSVSRLDNFQTGTYDVPATIETLIYGADNPYLKGLSGVSIVTENLPTGGSVVAYYRTDEDSSWVLMGTSDTVGKQKHNFTKANGAPIGKFQEIQFKFVITGKTAVKNILVVIDETNDLPF